MSIIIPGHCDRPGCPVLHNDPANPIHPEDLTRDFHERTGRCLGGGPEKMIHSECAGIELQHRDGEHQACLSAECGAVARVKFDARLTPQKRAESPWWQSLSTMLHEHDVFRALSATAKVEAVDRAWVLAEDMSILDAADHVLDMLRPRPDLSDVPTADLLAEVARRIDR